MHRGWLSTRRRSLAARFLRACHLQLYHIHTPGPKLGPTPQCRQVGGLVSSLHLNSLIFIHLSEFSRTHSLYYCGSSRKLPTDSKTAIQEGEEREDCDAHDMILSMSIITARANNRNKTPHALVYSSTVITSTINPNSVHIIIHSYSSHPLPSRSRNPGCRRLHTVPSSAYSNSHCYTHCRYSRPGSCWVLHGGCHRAC
jgi:hypothetical protein